MIPNEIIEYVETVDLGLYSKKNRLAKLLRDDTANRDTPANEWDTSERLGGGQFPPDLYDLARLHALVTKRRMINVLEFGSGNSTAILGDALRINRQRHGNRLLGVRRADPFKLTSIESEEKYRVETQELINRNDLKQFVDLLLSPARQTYFNGQLCGRYEKIPSCCPDLIYVDGPSPMSYKNGATQYMDMRHKEVTNVTCDVLIMEPVLLPGTVIIVDGSTNRARFIGRNLTREWVVHENTGSDYTILILDEPPLGKFHERQLNFQNRQSEN